MYYLHGFWKAKHQNAAQTKSWNLVKLFEWFQVDLKFFLLLINGWSGKYICFEGQLSMNYETSKIFIVKSSFETIPVELNSFKTRNNFFLFLYQILNDSYCACFNVHYCQVVAISLCRQIICYIIIISIYCWKFSGNIQLLTWIKFSRS